MGNEYAVAFGPNVPTELTSVGLSASPIDLGAQVDMLDPESLLAFFEMKMGDAKGQLNALIARQEKVNERVTLLQRFEGAIAGYPEGVKPGDPGWEAVLAAAKDAQAALGATSKEGKEIQAIIDAATKPTMVDKRFDDPQVAFAEASKHGTGVRFGMAVGPTGLEQGLTGYIVQVPEGAPKGLAKEDVQKLVSQTKALREGLQSDQQIQMIRVQQAVEQCSQLVNLASNIMRKLNEMAMAPINNMRG